jgi:DNA-binding MarR family transcriptional regulator
MRSYPSAYAAPYPAMAEFRYQLRKFLRFSKDYLAAEAHLTSEQYEALLALKAHAGQNGLTVGELSERLQIKHHSAVSLTDKLAARKLAGKHRQKDNRRIVCVALTAAGETLLARAAKAHHREIKRRRTEIIRALRQL